MAAYSLACAQAVAGSTEVAVRTLAEAIALNPDVRANADRDPDLRYVVRELRIEFLAPMTAPGLMLVELTASKLGTTSATYLFRCADQAGEVTFAEGHRVIVKIDEAGRPAPWSDWYRSTFEELARG